MNGAMLLLAVHLEEVERIASCKRSWRCVRSRLITAPLQGPDGRGGRVKVFVPSTRVSQKPCYPSPQTVHQQAGELMTSHLHGWMQNI